MGFLNRFKFALVGACVATAAFHGTAHATSIVFSASGLLTSSIQPTVDSFRTAVGNPNNGNSPGELSSGRREINWDGGGATTTATNSGPLTAFENTRGALLTTPGTGFTQATLAVGGLDAVFGNNPQIPNLFQTFSPLRVFTPVGSIFTDVTFSVPGTGGLAPATVNAFGAVFSDVDIENRTSIQYFDSNGGSLGTFFAPIVEGGPNQSLSFLGVFFDAGERVSRVRITTGNTALSSNAVDGVTNVFLPGRVDLVVMDDFIYSEPRSVPETSSLMLLCSGLAVAAFGMRIRRWRQ